MVYSTGDIIDTMVYRVGLVDAQYGVATAVGLFKSVIALILIATSNKLANKYTGYRIF
ncbi:putative multiple-sugar transport system permease YteP [compost metagenome]